MSILKQKLDKAAEQFQNHNFQESLNLYEDCLNFCYRTEESKEVIYNIMTTKGALCGILGDFDKAMATLNEVLKSDPNHYLALLRRSQVYKKRGKFNRALKDLENISSYCPDNLQITAMKIEIENMRQKNNASSSSEESEEEDEELSLNFMGLKKIDRKSVSESGQKGERKSRVTISGDTAFVYESVEDWGEQKSKSTALSHQQAKEKYQKTFKQIESDDEGSKQSVPEKTSIVIVKSSGNGRTKSILKNKNASTNILLEQTPLKEEKYGGRQSKLIDLIKDIDGKVINTTEEHEKRQSKEVQFRKSLYNTDLTGLVGSSGPKQEKPKQKSSGRKSCLKRSSFEKVEQEIKQKPARRSKFQTLSRESIDGIVIKNRKSIQLLPKGDMDEIKKEDGEQSDNEGSSFNIYGSKEQFSVGKEAKKEPAEKPKPKQRGKSILKKNSILGGLCNTGTLPKVEKLVEIPQTKKAKKSVMFNKAFFQGGMDDRTTI